MRIIVPLRTQIISNANSPLFHGVNPSRAVGHQIRLPVGAKGIQGVGKGGRNLSSQMEENRCGVLVGGDGSAERCGAEVLDRLGDVVVSGIAGSPEPVAFGEHLGTEGGETQQVIASVLRHADAVIVARVDAEIRTDAVA